MIQLKVTKWIDTPFTQACYESCCWASQWFWLAAVTHKSSRL